MHPAAACWPSVHVSLRPLSPSCPLSPLNQSHLPRPRRPICLVARSVALWPSALRVAAVGRVKCRLFRGVSGRSRLCTSARRRRRWSLSRVVRRSRCAVVASRAVCLIDRPHGGGVVGGAGSVVGYLRRRALLSSHRAVRRAVALVVAVLSPPPPAERAAGCGLVGRRVGFGSSSAVVVVAGCVCCCWFVVPPANGRPVAAKKPPWPRC